jgi:hypothetical protein
MPAGLIDKIVAKYNHAWRCFTATKTLNVIRNRLIWRLRAIRHLGIQWEVKRRRQSLLQLRRRRRLGDVCPRVCVCEGGAWCDTWEVIFNGVTSFHSSFIAIYILF